MLRGIFSAAAAMLLAACATVPNYPNAALGQGMSNPPLAWTPPVDPDEPAVLLAFSGGGSRATALGLSIIDQLRSVTYRTPSGQARLVDKVRVVSSVSGGSVIAGWYGLVGPDRVDEIRDKFLAKDNMATLKWAAADPLTWFRLAFSRYSRIDVLQGLLDNELFAGAKFSQMNQQNRPMVLLNATDIGTGEVFAFTPERFDDICSDLTSLSLSVGVAASAAYPIAFSPMNLQNFAGPRCPGNVPQPQWITNNLTLAQPRYLDVEEFKRARYANTLRHGNDSFRRIDFLHLIDGGVADNQGVHSLSDSIISTHSPIRLLNLLNTGKVGRIVVIAVNARSDKDSGIDASREVPGLLSVLNSVVGIPIDATTAYSNASLKALLGELAQAGADASQLSAAMGAPLFNIQTYGITIDFDQFRADQNAMRDKVKAIGTTWTLSPDQIDATMCAGKMLLWQHPDFQALLQDLGASARPPNPDPACEPQIP